MPYSFPQLKYGPSLWDTIWEKIPSIGPSWAAVPARKAAPAWDLIYKLQLLSGDWNYSQEQVLGMPQLPSGSIHLLLWKVPRGLEHIRLLFLCWKHLCHLFFFHLAIHSAFSHPSCPHFYAVFSFFFYISSQRWPHSRLTGSAVSCSGFAVDDWHGSALGLFSRKLILTPSSASQLFETFIQHISVFMV